MQRALKVKYGPYSKIKKEGEKMANATANATAKAQPMQSMIEEVPTPKHARVTVGSKTASVPTGVEAKKVTAGKVTNFIPSFIIEQAPDPSAAALRFSITSEMIANWSRAINETDTKNMPKKLIDTYQIAFKAIKAICEQERDIALQED